MLVGSLSRALCQNRRALHQSSAEHISNAGHCLSWWLFAADLLLLDSVFVFPLLEGTVFTKCFQTDSLIVTLLLEHFTLNY